MYATYYQPQHGYYQKTDVLQELNNGLALAALLITLVIFLNVSPFLALIAVVAELISFFIYWFGKKESTIVTGYYLFVSSTAILLGYTLQFYLAFYENGLLLIGYSAALTGLVVGGVYYRTASKQPDVSSLPRKLMPFSIAFLFIIILGLFVSYGQLGTFIVSVFGALLFSYYLYYDLGRVMRRQYRSPARAAWQIYWDILLIFQYILDIVTSLSGD